MDDPRARKLLANYYKKLSAKTDRIFCALFLLQFVIAGFLAIYVTPYSWAGAEKELHFHVYLALLFGGAIAALPIYLAYFYPGLAINRFVVAIAQMLFSTLFIHLSGGRLETHFHIFGSLAFLSFYRDFRVIALATGVTAVDHILRGIYWPESLYGVLAATPWRAAEHLTWMIFEDIFLLHGIRIGLRELKSVSENQAEIERTLASVEEKVMLRTVELEASQTLLTAHTQTLAASAKMSALGEMAGGIAHEINNPLAIIRSLSEQIGELAQDESIDRGLISQRANKLVETTSRITKIVQGLRCFSRDGSQDPFEPVKVATVMENTVGFCQERFQSHGVKLLLDDIEPNLCLLGREIQVCQVLLNLLNNAHDAIAHLPEKWVRVSVKALGDTVEIRVRDSGRGIPPDIAQKIFQPFFTTKEIGKGTGMGLSISLGIIKAHSGRLTLDESEPNTCFVLSLPLAKSMERAA